MHEEGALYDRRWWTLGVLCLSLLIVFVGNSSLNVTIPTLSRQLGASTSQLQWVVAAYSLVFAGLLFTAGAIGDRFGRKGALQLGLLGFLIAVAAASRATDMWQLIGCRALMGACAAFIMPSTLSILVNVFPPEERTKAIAIWAGISGSAGAIGQVASGWLLGHFWFGSVFLVNVPFVLAALVLGIFLVPGSRDPEEADLDLVGAGLSIVGISSLVYGLIEAPDKGWLGTATLAAFALGIVVMTVFVLWERHTDEPMLDMSFFRNPAFSTGTGGMILVFLAMFGVMFLITQYFQLVLGYSPLGAAVRFLPISPIMVVVAPLTPRITARIGSNRTVCCGMLLTGVGFAGFWLLTTHTPYAYVLACIAFLVGGIALTMSPMTAAIMSAVPPRRAGAGSAMNDATRELGSALGVAVLGSIAASRYGAGIGGAVRSLSRADQALARTSLGTALQTAQHLPARVAGPLVSAADRSFVSGIHVAALAGSALCVVAAMAVLRYLPHTILQQGALEAAEDTAVLGVVGGEPIHPSERDGDGAVAAGRRTVPLRPAGRSPNRGR